MDDYQKVWAICLAPLLLIYAIIEIKRGWDILKYKKYTLNFAYTAQIWLVNLSQGKEKSLAYKENLLNNTTQMNLSGFYSLLGGAITIIVCIFWMYLVIKL